MYKLDEQIATFPIDRLKALLEGVNIYVSERAKHNLHVHFGRGELQQASEDTNTHDYSRSPALLAHGSSTLLKSAIMHC